LEPETANRIGKIMGQGENVHLDQLFEERPRLQSDTRGCGFWVYQGMVEVDPHLTPSRAHDYRNLDVVYWDPTLMRNTPQQ
jgi:hypothetical protein